MMGSRKKNYYRFGADFIGFENKGFFPSSINLTTAFKGNRCQKFNRQVRK
jgi:hypothetical protein